MSPNELYYKNCKTFSEQITRIEEYIKDHKLYTSFNFSKLNSTLAEYRVWAQANVGLIEEALTPAIVAAPA
ncbi:MAG: hypothetical protein M3Y07_08395 [Acidobacteriota bacterium]|nr:hypothetical protein [Acidobacteriota bacterium]